VCPVCSVSVLCMVYCVQCVWCVVHCALCVVFSSLKCLAKNRKNTTKLTNHIARTTLLRVLDTVSNEITEEVIGASVEGCGCLFVLFCVVCFGLLVYWLFDVCLVV